MYFEESMATYLRKDAGVQAVLGSSLYPVDIPQDAGLPACAYQRISGPRELNHDGETVWVRARIQFTVDASTYAQAKSIAGAIKAALNGFSGRMEAAPVMECRIENESDGYSHASGVFTVRLDALFLYRE